MVFVVNREGTPLMPACERAARKLLAAGRARVVRRTPFTVRLLHGTSGYRQEVVAGLDTGSGVLGCAAIANGRVVYQAEVTLRNDISKKLEQRAMYRRTRRGRKTRYRPARFENRCASTRKGRLPPSLMSKINSHVREMRFVESILPVARWNLELAAFDIHKISNPAVTGAGYQAGNLKDFYNVRQYVLHRDGYACQSGQKGKHSAQLQVHHKQYRSDGGSDTADNLVTLCAACHAGLHAGDFALKEKGMRSKTRHATHMGIIKARLAACAPAHTATFGYETKYKREQLLKWPKNHANDAIAICLVEGEFVAPLADILIKLHIAKGDYQQRTGKHSQKTIPTGKLFGLRKGDKVATSRGIGFVKGKRSSGYFAIGDLDGTIIHASEKVANCRRLAARSTTQVEELTLLALSARRTEKECRMSAAKQTKAATGEDFPSARFALRIASRSAPVLTGLKADVSRSNI